MPIVILILHNIRSTYNVGSIFRSSEGLGVNKIICSGYTPYPITANDSRLPHIASKINKQIHKTALGAELMVDFEHQANPDLVSLRHQGFRVAGLEQDKRAQALPDYRTPNRLALILGEELSGISPELRAECDDLIEIPMHGQKESFNVSVAAGIALYHLTTRTS